MRTPIFDMLKKIKKENRTRFYMPGHKGGRLMGDEESLFSFDITEIEGADNLHAPEGAILEAQELAAHSFRADRTYFLVGGSTAGIHAMLASVAGDGDLVIMDRAAHKSAIYALQNAGATAVFLSPEMGEDNIPRSISPIRLREALKKYPEAKAVYLTSPNYYGECQDLEALIQVAHENNVLVLVDEAHGAHFVFNDRLPKSAMELGADAAVQSAHKTLPALTMSAYLHVKKTMPEDRVRESLQRFQSTSPSYLLMASLDYARAYMEEHREDFDRFLDDLIEIFGVSPSPNRDMTRLVFTPGNMSGYRAADILRNEYGIEAEMADSDHVVMIPTMGNTKEELWKLKTAMEEIEKRPGKHRKIQISLPEEAMLNIRSEWAKKRQEKSLKESVGATCASMLYLYPPGIPILLPGETVTEQKVQELEYYAENGMVIQGMRNDGKILIFDSFSDIIERKL